MNKVVLIGRLTADPERVTTAVRYTLAVDRWGDKGADFIRCVAFDKRGDFAMTYLHKGMKIAVAGRIQTGSYKNKDGKTVYTTDIVVDDQEFCEKKQDFAPDDGEENPFV